MKELLANKRTVFSVISHKTNNMKRSVVFMIAMAITAAALSQDCKQYYFLQNNKTVEMTILSKKGDPAGKNIYHISDVQTTGGVTSGTVNSEMFDKKGKSIAKGVTNIKCSGGAIMVDMKMMIPQQQMEQFNTEAKAEGAYLEYPNNMKVGDQLKDGSFKMTSERGPMTYTMTMDVTERKVEGKETITTPAGTWDCFKITNKTKMVIKMGVNIPSNFQVTEWYAPGFGIVKTENSKGGGTEITAVK